MYDRRIFRLTFAFVFAATACCGTQTSWSLSTPPSSERSHFRKILAENPDFFEFAEDSILPFLQDTFFEQLVSIGLNPVLNLLEAAIEIKQPDGYSGDLCSNGSWEYVRFYTNCGSGWTDLGYSAVNVHDIPNLNDCSNQSEKPLFYTLTIPFTCYLENCLNPILPKVRGILSWNVPPPPNSPKWLPVYGNVLNQHVQAQPVNPSISIHPTSVTLDSKRNRHVDSPNIYDGLKSTVNKVFGATWSAVTPKDNSKSDDLQPSGGAAGDTMYEELIDLGLDYNFGNLVATIRIKLRDGYGSDLCGNGSWEYISFWADWEDTCEWMFLGTVRNQRPQHPEYSAAWINLFSSDAN